MPSSIHRVLLAAAVLSAPTGLSACSSHSSDAAGKLGDGGVIRDGGGAPGSGNADSGSGAAADGGSQGIPGTFVPSFPGAGTGNSNTPLVGGMLCDYVPHAGEKGGTAPLTECFFQPGQTTPAAALEQVLECVDGKDSVHLRLTFDPAFVDNTYGANSLGWTSRRPQKPGKVAMGGHSWNDLVESDHAEIMVTNGDGQVALQFKLDYISQDASAASGYASLGVSGGDGAMVTGNPAAILDYNTSIARNFNERGHSSYTTDSPKTDAMYTPDPAAPDWDFRVVYEVWVDIHAFGDSGFGSAFIENVHASPSKAPTNTIEVEPGPCPPEWCNDPDGCDPYDKNPDGGVRCVATPDMFCSDSGAPIDPPPPCVSGPDTFCSDGGLPVPANEYCTDHPDDSRCTPE